PGRPGRRRRRCARRGRARRRRGDRSADTASGRTGRGDLEDGRAMAQLTRQDGMAADAVVAAARAAAAAGVMIRELPAVDEQADAIRLLADIWKRAPENPPVPPELLRAMSKAGNYIAGAYDGDLLVGVAIAFHMNPQRHALHSHIAGIAPAHAGRSAGFALKQHQRAWALAQGIDTIEWTYDPLVARN